MFTSKSRNTRNLKNLLDLEVGSYKGHQKIETGEDGGQ